MKIEILLMYKVVFSLSHRLVHLSFNGGRKGQHPFSRINKNVVGSPVKKYPKLPQRIQNRF